MKTQSLKTKLGAKGAWRLLAVATVVFFIIAGLYFVLVPVRESKQLEQTLIDRYGWAQQYSPPIDGALSSDRIDRFILVREAVQGHCAQYRDILDDIIGLESLESKEEMSTSEKTSEGMDSFKNMFSAFPKLLKFMEARNTALLAQEMGLGEYIYIYFAAYGPQLAAESDSAYADMEDAFASPRTIAEYGQILEKQLNALSDAGSQAETEELRSRLQQEITDLKSGAQPSPWPNGPGGKLSESLSLYSAQLNSLYCPGVARIDLLQKNKGFNLEG